jgi:hypothetical protein
MTPRPIVRLALGHYKCISCIHAKTSTWNCNDILEIYSCTYILAAQGTVHAG